MEQQQIEQEEEEEGSAGSAGPEIGEIVGFIVRSAKRHKLGSWVCFASIALTGLVLAPAVPLKFLAESRILIVDTKSMVRALSRDIPQADALVGSTEFIKRKDSLTYVVKEAGLLQNWKATRPWPMRLKDRLSAILLGLPSEADLIDALTKTLDQRCMVVRDNNLLIIRVLWPDARMAQKLTRLTQNRFLEMRRQQETANMTSAIEILQAEAKKADEAMMPIVERLTKTRQEARERLELEARGMARPPEPPRQSAAAEAPAVRKAPVSLATAANAVPARSRQDPELAARLNQIRQQRQETETAWRRRAAEQRQRLADLRVTLGPSHPAVVEQATKLEKSEVEPAELGELRDAEQQTLDAIANIQFTDADESNSSATPARRAGGAFVVSRTPKVNGVTADTASTNAARSLESEPAVAAASAELTSAMAKYRDLSEKLSDAQLNLAATQTAFDQRYQVVLEPEFPSKPMKPIRTIVAVGAVAVGALIALLFGAIRELMRARVVEAWQVKLLGIPNLGEVSQLPPRRP